MKKKDNHTGLKLGLAANATAAGAYYLYGSDKASAHRKTLKSWMLKMKAEVMDEIESMKDISEEVYNDAIDKISEKYSQVKNVDETELKAVVKKLKGHWKDIKKEVKKATPRS